MNYAHYHYLFAQAGSIFGETLVKVTGGPVDNYSNQTNGGWLPYIIPDILPPIIIPKKDVAAAELMAGILYGITQQEHLDQLGECFYGGDEFLYDILKGYNMIAS